MKREEAIRELHDMIESMARLHIWHGLYHSKGFQKSREAIRKLIQEHNVDVRKELAPEVATLYRRYFD